MKAGYVPFFIAAFLLGAMSGGVAATIWSTSDSSRLRRGDIRVPTTSDSRAPSSGVNIGNMFTSADSDIHQKRFDFELRSSPLVATTSDFIIPDGEFRWSRSDFSLALTQVVATTPEFLLCDPGFAHVADLRGGNAPHEGQEGLYIGDDTRIYLPQERTPGFLPYATRLEHYAADYWALPSNDWSPTLVRIIASKSVEVNGRPALLQIYQTGTVSSDGMFSVNEYDADLDLRIVLFEGERSLIVATRRADEDGLEQLARVASCVIWR